MIRKGSIIHRFFQKKEQELYRASDYIGCMSPANVEFIRNHHPEIQSDKVEVNPNSIKPFGRERTTASVEAIRSQYNIPSGATVLIYGGNLGKPQGIDFLLTVLESNSENDNIFFVVAGGGTEFPKVKEWFDHKQLVNALLLGSMPKQEYDRLVKACDVGLVFLDKRFTIPNFPSRMLPYLEQKMPVLAATDRNTDIGIILEQAGAGLWVEAGDLAGFNNKLMQLTSPETLRLMGENALRLLETRYTVDVSFETIIRKLPIHLAV
jgi:glycosyltransferase involved in cell wall biosynthesis